MNITLVYNPKSGSSLSRQALRKKCDAANITIDKFVAIGDGFERKLSSAITAGASIAVIGGDGTVSAVAGLVANTKATLIPLPGGTLNHFTKDLDIPQDVDEALARLRRLKPHTIDIASVNDMMFINNSSIGLYPASLRSREKLESKLSKWSAAVVASWRAFINLQTYRVTIDDKSFATPFIFIGNNRYKLDDIGTTERTRLDEGVLTVYIAKTRSRFTLLKIALFALIGRAAQLDEFEQFYPTTLTIETTRQHLSVSHDGEVSRLTSPLRYTVHPKSLKILG
jgi:diacylglycerol kinase family enzyme